MADRKKSMRGDAKGALKRMKASFLHEVKEAGGNSREFQEYVDTHISEEVVRWLLIPACEKVWGEETSKSDAQLELFPVYPYLELHFTNPMESQDIRTIYNKYASVRHAYGDAELSMEHAKAAMTEAERKAAFAADAWIKAEKNMDALLRDL